MIRLTEQFVELMQAIVFGSGSVVALFILAGLSALVFTKKSERHLLRKRPIAWIMFCGPLVLVLHYYVWHQLPKLDSIYQRVILGTISVVVFSSVLFLLKVEGLKYYSILEILFAIAFCASTLYSLNDVESPFRLIGVGSAVYLIIRGLDNYRRYLIEREEAERKELAKAATTTSAPPAPTS